MDAVGGGGWGPIVTSTLLSRGRTANYTIGSVNLAEFFIALAGAGTFLIFTGISGWQTIIGLVIGGIIASPFAAFLVSRVKRKPIMITVAVLIIGLSLRTFLTLTMQSFGIISWVCFKITSSFFSSSLRKRKEKRVCFILRQTLFVFEITTDNFVALKESKDIICL